MTYTAPIVKRALKLTVSLAITFVSFWWTFKDTHWVEMWGSLRSAHWMWLFPYVAILGGIHVSRTLRWGYLLSGMEKVSFRKLNHASAVGFMMLLVLPFRLGEFARPFLIAQHTKIRRSAAMTSVVLERIVDGMFIAVLLRGLLFFIPGENQNLQRLRWGANLMFAIFFSGLMFLLFAVWQQARAVGLVRATVGKVSPGLADKAAEMVDGFVGAMRQLPSAGQTFGFFVFTAVYWLLNGLGMSVLARAFDCALAGTMACTPMGLSFFQGFTVLAVLVIGLMIPAAPGSAGTFQAFVVLALSIFLPPAVVHASGIAYANVLWLTQIIQQIAYGLLMMLLYRESFQALAGKLSDESELAVNPEVGAAPR